MIMILQDNAGTGGYKSGQHGFRNVSSEARHLRCLYHRRKGTQKKIGVIRVGQCFGEISLWFESKRSGHIVRTHF